MTRPGEPVGSIAEEVAKLIAALQDWSSRNLAASAEHIATGAPECSWCPICQAIAVLRGERPEVSEKVATAAALAIDALRAVMDAASAHSAAQPATSQTSEAQRPVQRIRFSEPDKQDGS